MITNASGLTLFRALYVDISIFFLSIFVPTAYPTVFSRFRYPEGKDRCQRSEATTDDYFAVWSAICWWLLQACGWMGAAMYLPALPPAL